MYNCSVFHFYDFKIIIFSVLKLKDISGWTRFRDGITQDLENNLLPMRIFNSSGYAIQNGKPVVCVWGFGFSNRPDNSADGIALINYLKSRGFFVIGGCPGNWATNDGKKNRTTNNLKLGSLNQNFNLRN